MLLTLYILAIIVVLHESTCQNVNSNTSNAKRTYFFRMGKNNELKVNNRIYFLYPNFTDNQFVHKPHKPVTSTSPGKLVKIYEKNLEPSIYWSQQNDYLLDTEWDFNHTNVTRRELPLFIHKLYETHASLFPKTTTRILFNTNNNGSSRIMKFNLNSLKPNKEQVLEADLYFFWPLDSNSTIYRESVVMRLYQFEKQKDAAAGDSAAENPDIHKVFNVIYISKAQRGWQTFKIKKPIDNWLNGEENLGLLLTISSYDDNKLITIFNDTNNGIYSTFAIITVQNNDTVSSFNTVEYKTHGTPTNCQRTEWNVNFQYKNWNKFIISPDGFRAYDCSGKCLGTEEDHENHLKLLYTYHRRPPCCVPVEYSPLPIMFYDKYGNVIIKNYQNMIVTKCGCR